MSFQLHERVFCDLPLVDPYPYQDNFIYCTSTLSHWHKCREVATNYLFSPLGQSRKATFYAFRYAFYKWPAYSCKWHIVRMFDYVESRMGWWDRTRIHDTQHHNAVKVCFSGGWFQNYNSISLATLLLRLGPYFSTDISFDEILNKNEYSQKTKLAIYRFLDGFQHYRGATNNGWVKAFENATPEKVNHDLIHRRRVEELAKQIKGERKGVSDHEAWLVACHNLLYED